MSESTTDKDAWIGKFLGVSVQDMMKGSSSDLMAFMQSAGAKLQIMKSENDPRLGALIPLFAAAGKAVKEKSDDAAEKVAIFRDSLEPQGHSNGGMAEISAKDIEEAQHRKTFETERDLVQGLVESLNAKVVAGDRAMIERDMLGAAEKAAEQGDWEEAAGRLKAARNAYEMAQETVVQHESYELKAKAARDLLATLTDPSITPEIKSIQTDLIDAAETATEMRDYGTAEDLLAKVAGKVAAAEIIVRRHATFEQTLDIAKKAVATLTEPRILSDKDTIEKTLIAPAEDDATRRRYDDADQKLSQVAALVEQAKALAVKAGEYEARLKLIKERVVKIIAPIASPEVKKVNDDCITVAETAAKPPGRDFAGAMIALQPADALCDLAELHVRRYTAGLEVAKKEIESLQTDFNKWTSNYGWAGKAGAIDVAGISDVLANATTGILDPAEVHAANGRYAEAMPMLESIAGTLAPAWKLENEFSTFLIALNKGILAYNAAIASPPAPALDTALKATIAEYYRKAIASGKLGQFTAATTFLTNWEAVLKAMLEVCAKWTLAATAVNTLTLACIDTDKTRVQTDCMDEAGSAVTAGDLPLAHKHLDEAIRQCPLILAYGTALDAAENDLSNVDDMYDEDVQQIRDDLIDPADNAATANEYALGTDLLLKVPANAAGARTVFLGVAATQSDVSTAQGTIADTVTDPDAAVQASRAVLQQLETHSAEDRMADKIKEIRDLIEEAEQLIASVDPLNALMAPELIEAQTKLGDAMTRAPAVRTWLEEWARFEVLHDRLEDRIDLIDAAAADEAADLRTSHLDQAWDDFDPGDTGTSLELLAQGEVGCASAEEIARLSLAYDAALIIANNDLNTLSAPYLTTDKAKIKQDTIDAAAVEAGNRDFKAALDLLKPLAASCVIARDILAQQLLCGSPFAETKKGFDQAKVNLNNATLAGLPARPDIVALCTDIDTNHMQAANTLSSTRGLGQPALDVMKRIVALLKEGGIKASRAWNESGFYKLTADRLNLAKTALDLLKTHKGKAEITSEITQLDALMTNAAILSGAAQSAKACELYREVETECAANTVIAQGAEEYGLALTPAEERVNGCQGKVDLLSPVPPDIALRFATMKTETITQAIALASVREFIAAKKLLATIDARCKIVEALVVAEGLYTAALKTAEEELAKLTGEVVAVEAARIGQNFITPAKAAAVRSDYPAAMKLLEKVAGEVATAGTIAKGAEASGTAREEASDGLNGPLPGAILAVEKLLKTLLIHAEAEAIKDLTESIQKTIEAVKIEPAPEDATKQLTAAADGCGAARTAADREVVFKAAAADALSSIGGISGRPLVDAEFNETMKCIEDAKKLAVAPGRDFAGATKLIDQAVAATDKAVALLTRDRLFEAMLLKAQNTVDSLNALKPRRSATIGTQVEALQANRLDAAKTLAGLPKRDHDGAEKLLEGIDGECKALGIRRMMRNKTMPIDVAIKDLMDQPGGIKQLDDMIAGMSDTTDKAVMEAAIKVRFGLTSFQNIQPPGDDGVEGTGKSKTLKKIYELLAKVPDSHARDNPSLDKIERYSGKKEDLPEHARGASYFQGATKKVVLTCGRAADNSPQPLQRDPLVLPDVEPDCEMVPDTEVPAPKYFDWTTLHEVGHAIDHKKRFMNGKAGDSNFGGWQEHGADVVPVAKAAAKTSRFDSADAEKYLIAYLVGGNPVTPVPPDTSRDWEACRVAAVAWCDDIRVGKEMWENGGGSSSHAVDGRVYHEAYDGSWVSYDLAARTKGITGYQFRAPGEWLSELYAAFHCGKLKKSHPAAAWLQTL